VDEFRALGQMLEQTERFGTELARMVAVQCDTLRHAELQDLEERAHEASVKMLFPLTALLLPATLLVIVGPLLIMLFDALRQATSD
jgi:tight adherence protein C